MQNMKKMNKRNKRLKIKKFMIYDVNSINISSIRQKKSLFEDEKAHFKTRTYDTFLSSYLINSGDEYIKIIANRLNELYKIIEKDYDLIFKWWDSYVENVSSLERCLSNDLGTFGMTESTIRNFVDYNLRNKI